MGRAYEVPMEELKREEYQQIYSLLGEKGKFFIKLAKDILPRSIWSFEDLLIEAYVAEHSCNNKKAVRKYLCELSTHYKPLRA